MTTFTRAARASIPSKESTTTATTIHTKVAFQSASVAATSASRPQTAPLAVTACAAQAAIHCGAECAPEPGDGLLAQTT